MKDMCRSGSEILFHPQQQAIEDLQSEEEKVNLLTKEKTKLQMQAEDVSLYSLCLQSCSFLSQFCMFHILGVFCLKLTHQG